MSVAYASTLEMSFEVRGGLLMRQIHHWSALMFVGLDRRAHVPGVLHRRVPQAARDELDGRLPADPGLAAGFTGYSLPDDVLSRQRPAHHRRRRQVDPGHRLATCRTSSSAGSSRATHIIPRLFILHILLVPGLLLALIGAAPVPGGAAEAHPVPRRWPHRQERRRATRCAGVRGQGRATSSSSSACWP